MFITRHFDSDLQQRFSTQNGAVLAISLIMLMILAMIGTFGMQNSVLQERMSGNMRDKDLAFQAAESTLKQVQRALSSGTISLNDFSNDGSGGFYSVTIPQNVQDLLTDQNLTTNNSFWTETNAKVAIDNQSNLENDLFAPPRYIVQELNPINGYPAYRITVRSNGKSENTVVILQAVFTTG